MSKTIRSGTREVIFKVFSRCLAELESGVLLTPLENVFQRTADLTGKSVSTIRIIVEEGEQNRGVFCTPGKQRKGRPKKELDDFDLCAIRQKVQFFYTVKKQVPTLRNLLPVEREELGFSGCREHLRRVLLSLGFRYRKCQSERTALIEKPIIAAKRETYLEIIMANRNLPEELQKDIIYLDESYVHQSYKLKKCWQSLDVSGVRESISKGKRYIIVHAGSEKGFVPNALLIFSGKNKNEDYHSDMNSRNFTKWVQEKFIPNLPSAAIIVLDNAPYHSVILNKAPTSGTKVAEIRSWLHNNNIPFDINLKKPHLLLLVKRYKPEPKYEIDELLGAYGHTVVRLPPYHCDLNPIELIWAIAKHKIASYNMGSIDIKEATERAFAEVTIADWKNSCEHVKKIEKDYYDRSATLYDDVDRFVVNLQDDSSDSSSESETEGESEMQISDVEFLEEEILD